MSAPAKAHEPTMEEILASIRRIISDDDPAAAKPAPQPAANAPSGELRPALPDQRQDEVDAMFAAMDEIPGVKQGATDLAPKQAPPSQVELSDDLDVLELTDEMDDGSPPKPERGAQPERPAPGAGRVPAAPDRLLSPGTDETVSNAFGNLAHTILAGNARTLDDIVREMLRPMLRAWLDDNLPPLVERLVRQEIERVARGGR